MSPYCNSKCSRCCTPQHSSSLSVYIYQISILPWIRTLPPLPFFLARVIVVVVVVDNFSFKFSRRAMRYKLLHLIRWKIFRTFGSSSDRIYKTNYFKFIFIWNTHYLFECRLKKSEVCKRDRGKEGCFTQYCSNFVQWTICNVCIIIILLNKHLAKRNHKSLVFIHSFVCGVYLHFEPHVQTIFGFSINIGKLFVYFVVFEVELIYLVSRHSSNFQRKLNLKQLN